jgi:hypothetical protein
MSAEQQHILVGLVGYSHPWKTILDQIGVPWVLLDELNALSHSQYSLLVCNAPLTSEQQSLVQEYVRTGGAVLYTTRCASVIATRSRSKRYCTSLPPVRTAAYSYSDILDLYSTVILFEDETLISTQQHERGLISYFGIDVDQFFRTGTTRKGFYADHSRLPHEAAAARPLNPLRQLIQSHLEYLHHQRELPFVHKWFFPADRRSVFTFRIDSDKGTQAQVEEIYQVSEDCSIPTTWFLDVKSHESWLPYFSKFVRQEVAVHCYEHTIHPGIVMNRENFEKALNLLRHHGFSPKGIAAPTGAWSNAVGAAIQELGFTYSSEFVYDYDGLPSYPLVNGTFSSVLQLPMHPTCIGTMRREGMTPEDMVRYFKDVIDKKLALREPVCLYHHPGHETNKVFQEVFQYINGLQVLPLTYEAYAAWWTRRSICSVNAAFYGSQVVLSSTAAAEDTFVRITAAGGSETITAPDRSVALSELQLQTTEQYSAPGDIMRARRRTVRHYIQNALDWWIKTTE